MNKLTVLVSIIGLMVTACGTRHGRISGGKAPVKMTMFEKTDLQISQSLKTAWGKEWDEKDPKSQELANEISGVGVVTNSRVGDSENVTVTIVHTDCKVPDVTMAQNIKPGSEAQTIESAPYKVQIKCVSKDQSCNEYSVLITKVDADKNSAGSVAVFVRQNMNDFKKVGDEKITNEHTQVWWVKTNAEPMIASKATTAKAEVCKEESPAPSEGK